MSAPVLSFDPALLRRHDRPGPRYTSYPTAPQFRADFGEAELRAHIRRSNEDPVPSPLSLYAHIPFCQSPCFYCACNRVITRDLARGETFLLRLLREAEQVSALFHRDREVVQLHLGGGTPNFLPADRLEMLVESLGRLFHFSRREDRDFSIELDPRHVKPGDAVILARAGFNRVSLGVQDFDPEVQAAVNRIQSVAATLGVIDECRSAGIGSINLDLIYGLPRQTEQGFSRTLDIVVRARPQRLAIYAYAHMPHMFRPQRRIDATELPDPETKLRLLGLAVEKLTAAGYRYIGMDHFALPGDPLCRAMDEGRLHRNFMGYTTHAGCDLIGLGPSAVSHIGGSYSQNFRDLPAWEEAVDAGRLPVFRGLEMTADDRLRADVIQQIMCRGEVDMDLVSVRHGVDFNEYFREAFRRLEPLLADGLVEVDVSRIRVTPRGRLLLRVIAMCFDAAYDVPAEATNLQRRTG
jgi:oxygen-independent coproporphyrinogen-3 oxidase